MNFVIISGTCRNRPVNYNCDTKAVSSFPIAGKLMHMEKKSDPIPGVPIPVQYLLIDVRQKRPGIIWNVSVYYLNFEITALVWICRYR